MTSSQGQVRSRVVVLVNGLPGSGKSTLASRLARALGLPLFSKDVIKEAVADQLPADVVAAHGAANGRVGPGLGAGATEAMWSLLALSPVGAVVESFWRPGNAPLVRAGLTRAGCDPALVPEVFCTVPGELARRRFEQRSRDGLRHVVHGAQVDLPWWPEIIAESAPLGLGPAIRVDTSAPQPDAEVTAVARRVWAAYGLAP